MMRVPCRFRPGQVCDALAGLLVFLAASLPAQSPAGNQAGTVTGFVIDAGTGAPLVSAAVAIEAAGDVTVVQRAGSGAFLSRGATTSTGPDGSYRFTGLGPGAYRLHVRHLGYREAVIDVDLSASSPFRVSVGLVVSPILLEPVGVESPGGQPFGPTRTALEEASFGRVEAEMLRQTRFLESDARVLTQSEVSEAVTLGESDLLRALQRLPGVAARDDYTAGLWIRGAPWGQTRAYYDGLPLFNPVHAFGLLSSLNPDAVGMASFHPGVRSAAIGEGAAGVLSMTSRSADRPGVHGLSELSVTSARATVDLRSQNGMRGLVLGVRRSYVDAATRLAQLAGGDSAAYVPYSFLDLTLRGDLRLTERTALSVSGLWAEDNIHGGIRSLLQETQGRWGNQLAQVTLDRVGERARMRASIGASRFDGLINPPAAPNISELTFGGAAPPADARPVPSHNPTSNALTVVTANSEISEASGSRRPAWSAGVQFTGYLQSFSGQHPRPYPVAVRMDTLFLDEKLVVPALWGEYRWIGPHLALETGLRLESPQGALNAPRVSAAPRATLRYTIGGGRATFSAGVARSWQYTQALAPAGPSVGPDLYLTDVWLLSGDTVPAIRADIATLGGEVSLSDGWVASATGYIRRSTGLALPDPTPGMITDNRPVYVPGKNHAQGIEIGIRRIVGRFTASASYALAKSTMRASGWEFASPADRRHVVDATAMYRVTPGVRIGAAMTAASGSPFSRFMLTPLCDTVRCSQDTLVTERIELPMAVRTPAYAALDFLLDWEGRLGSVRIGAFLQVRNVLNRVNAVTYTGSYDSCSPRPPELLEARPGVCDRFDAGIPLLPLAGVRIAF